MRATKEQEYFKTWIFDPQNVTHLIIRLLRIATWGESTPF